MRSIMFVLAILYIAAGLEVRDGECSENSLFNMSSFTLEYYPPDASGYSMPLMFGEFNQFTYIEYVVGAWSTNNSYWNDFQSYIYASYYPTMQVMFAPWIKFSSLPQNESDPYYGRLELFGTVSSESEVSLLWCTNFTVPYVPTN